MYQALYRKYRPATFDDVVGQEVVITTLKNAINNNKLSHAYIFSGPRGTGKTSIAKILAKAVNCMDPNKIICDKCTSCIEINKKQSNDIIEIDAASNNGIDEIREIRNKVNLVPTTGKYKIYIIDEVHMLTTGAFNALLKTLEEPPSHAIFILATTEVHKIPTTIISRCQKFEFKKIENSKMFKRIKEIASLENIKIDDNCIEEIIRLSDGGLRDCISLLDQINAYSNGNICYEDICEVNGIIDYKVLKNFIIAIFNKDLNYILKEIQQFNENGKNFVKIADELLIHLRNILLLNVNIDLLNNTDYNKFLNINVDDVIKLIENINNGINSIKDSSDPLLAFEIIILKFCDMLTTDYQLNFYNYQLEKQNSENSFTFNEKENQNNYIQTDEDICNRKLIENIDNKICDENDQSLLKINESNNSSENTLKNLNDIYNIEKNSNFLENEDVVENDNFINSNCDNINIIENNSIIDEKKNDVDDNLTVDQIINKLQTIRIDNALSKFNKQVLIAFKNKMIEFKKYSNNDSYSIISDIILDGNLKAISDEYIVFMYDTSLNADTFNRKINGIEDLIKKVFEKKLKAIAIDQNGWEIIKSDFNNKTRDFIYKEENDDLFNLLLTKLNEEQKKLDDLYGSLVKYEEEK